MHINNKKTNNFYRFMRRSLEFRASSLDCSSITIMKWRFLNKDFVFFQCKLAPIQNGNISQFLNFLAFSLFSPIAPIRVLLQCIETGRIERRILSPISCLCLAKKKLEKLQKLDYTILHIVINVYKQKFQSKEDDIREPPFLLWLKIWQQLEFEIKPFQVCTWTGSILICLDILERD